MHTCTVDILRKFDTMMESVIPQLPTSFEDVSDPDGKSALIWMLGEYGEVHPRELYRYSYVFHKNSFSLYLSLSLFSLFLPLSHFIFCDSTFSPLPLISLILVYTLCFACEFFADVKFCLLCISYDSPVIA